MVLPEFNKVICACTLALVGLGGVVVVQANHEPPVATTEPVVPVASDESTEPATRDEGKGGSIFPKGADDETKERILAAREAAEAKKRAAKTKTTAVPSSPRTIRPPRVIVVQPTQPQPTPKYYVPNITGSGPFYPNHPAPQAPGGGQFNLGDINVPSNPSAAVGAICHNMPEASICQ